MVRINVISQHRQNVYLLPHFDQHSYACIIILVRLVRCSNDEFSRRALKETSSRTSRGDVHWILPALAGIPFGYSMLGTVSLPADFILHAKSS